MRCDVWGGVRIPPPQREASTPYLGTFPHKQQWAHLSCANARHNMYCKTTLFDSSHPTRLRMPTRLGANYSLLCCVFLQLTVLNKIPPFSDRGKKSGKRYFHHTKLFNSSNNKV